MKPKFISGNTIHIGFYHLTPTLGYTESYSGGVLTLLYHKIEALKLKAKRCLQ